jgi:hypothetical protein
MINLLKWKEGGGFEIKIKCHTTLHNVLEEILVFNRMKRGKNYEKTFARNH